MTKKEVNKILKWFERLNDQDYEHPKTKEELFKLEDLYISCLKYKIPKEIAKLKKIKKLVIGFSGINGEIPKEIKYFKHLKELHLAITGIFKVNRNLYKLKKLTKLDLAGNDFIEVPKGISALKNLEELDLSFYFGKLPKDISLLKKLENLKYSKFEHLSISQQFWLDNISNFEKVT